MRATEAVMVVRGEEELLRRTAHLFEAATDVACAANDLATWARTPGLDEFATVLRARRATKARIRKIYRSGVLLDPVAAQRLATDRDQYGLRIRITTDEINETIVLDGRLVILAGDPRAGQRRYSVITQPETVQGVASLFEAVWRSATELAVFDARVAEIRRLAPQVLELLSQGCKDETAARTLGLGVRTYRRRVAELLAALNTQSRFQAGVRARELGLL